MEEGNTGGVFLSILPAGQRDRRFALAVIILSAAVFGATVPFARVRLPAIPAFVACYQSALATDDIITSLLLFGHFAILRSRALLWLGSGYLFTAAIAAVHALTFPDLFSTTGLFNAGPQTTVWLYMLWHGAFPLLLIGYALSKGENGGPVIKRSVRGAILKSVGAVAIAVLASTWITSEGHEYLPVLLQDGHYTPVMKGVVSLVWSLSALALAILWLRRPHSALDVWLMVVTCAWIFDIGLSAVLNEVRFDLGFYVGRAYGLVAASFVLAVWLVETASQQAGRFRSAEQARREAISQRDRFSERERLFSAAVESSNDAIIATLLDGKVTGWNSAAQDLFGLTSQEAIGESIDIITPEGLREELHEILGRTREGIVIRNFETRRHARDGSEIAVLLSVAPVKSQAGEIVGATQIMRDVGEARKTESALRQETEERRRIFETSQDLILVTDPRGNFVQVSPSALPILGYRPEEMIGRSAVDFLYSGDLENTREEMRAARRGQIMRNFVTRYVHKDGRVVPLTWMGTWSEPVRRHFFIGRDMTEMQAAQEALLDSERMARRIIETALDAFVQMDDAGLVTDWNPQAEKIFGWSRAEVTGRLLADLIVPEPHRARHRDGLRDYLLTGHGPILGTRFEIGALRRDGKEITVEVSITAIERRGRHVFNGFMRDVTEKIAGEAQFRQAQKMDAVGQLTGGVAHDFNNMLTVIMGTIEILADGVADRPHLAAVAKLIDEAAEQGAELTRHLLAFARKQPLQPREVDVNDLITTTSKLLRPTLGEHIEIEVLLDDGPWLAFVDPNQLTTAILNLALNSRDAMPQGGRLILETSNATLDESYAGQHSEVTPGEYVLIAISDTGVGIPADLIDKIFEPFFTTKEMGRGTGLGLSMVYGFVKQSGGHIKVYSEQGHGTTVRLYLPRSKERSRGQAEAAVARPLEGGNELVLVVEDDALVRNYVIAQIRSLGYRTLSAANADEALRVIRDEPAIDLLFSDVIMPGRLNGRQLVDEATRLRPSLKVLYTSGYTENAIVHQGRLDPGVLLLAKPYRKEDLARMLRVALGAGTVVA